MRQGIRRVLVGLMAAVLLIVIATPAAGGNEEDYKVGKTAKSSDLKFTVHGFTNPHPPPSEFATPQPGYHFVSVDVEVINRKSEQQVFSSLLLFHLLDGKNRQYDTSLIISAALNPPSPDGQIPAKGSIRGLVGFEVPDSAKRLKFRAQGSITADGAIWKLK